MPTAPEAFNLLVDQSGKFRVPAVFVTNAGNALRSEKAEQLSQWLGIEVSTEIGVFSQFSSLHKSEFYRIVNF